MFGISSSRDEVAGYAVGGGHVLHMVCDLTIPTDNAIFGQTGPKVGSFDVGYGSSIMSRPVYYSEEMHKLSLLALEGKCEIRRMNDLSSLKTLGSLITCYFLNVFMIETRDLSNRHCVVSWKVLISGYAKIGDVEVARLVFDPTLVKDLGI
ncbi:hypothetical protein L1987_53081 [Smallanthus sonchifolius]|uniref:Uncharacterized protein n=1 Tax=Smallanthus sonchifolius TaxID=185202 RepID=A0ACB9EW46_9ASTR|nr:hypothetical protein L1987_53081 [Smallanthus sonchifolius]